MKYIFELIYKFIITTPNSQIVLLITCLYSYITGHLIFKSAIFNIIEWNKTNRQIKLVRKNTVDLKISIKNYVKLVDAKFRNIIIIFILAYRTNIIMSILIFILTLLSLLLVKMQLITWCLFVLKLLIVNLIGHLLLIKYGNLGKNGGGDWNFH